MAIYLRVSTRDQVEGYSLDEQLRQCRKFVRQKGWHVYKVYSDAGYSGTHTRRPAFRQMQRDAHAGRFQGVVAHSINRLFRNLQGMIHTYSEWQTQDIFFVSVREYIDFTTPWGQTILAILSSLAESFIHDLRQETRKGLRGRFHKGLHNGPIPFGYCNGRCSTCSDPNGPGYCPRAGLPDMHHGQHAIPHPLDSSAYVYAHRLYRTGLYTDRDIAEVLNHYCLTLPDGQTQTVRSRGRPGRGPGPFTKDMVREMLQNPFYAGLVPFYGSEYKGKQLIKHARLQDLNTGLHPPLISQEDFKWGLHIRALKGRSPQGRGRKGHEQGKSAPRRAARVYLLAGLLDCARCGAPMHSQAGGGNARRHVCSTRLQRKGLCDQPSVKADRLERELDAQMARLRLPPDWQEAVIAYLLDEGGLEALRARRRQIEDHFEHIRALYNAEQIGRQTYLAELRLYERQLAALSLDGQTTINLARARALLADFGALWKRLTPREQQGIARTLLRAATVEAGHILRWSWYSAFAPLQT
ncbi:MAG: hypothetical protein D6796_15325 [Caldilineae bacterium]|nr:MAG: hypothetical protein D6796_15325 [Caldilineae bacterium]